MSEAETCTHNCDTCGADCPSRTQPQDLRASLSEGVSVRKVYAVVSGKGGVGKSMVTSLLASQTRLRGYSAAVLDADVTGPSIPQAFGVHGRAQGTGTGILPAVSRTGVQMMSINLLLENETDPVVWRGPVIGGAVKQFWTDVLWDDVDYMYVDMPPGTGDVPLTVFQSLPIDGIIIVTTPQELVGMIVDKAVNMARLMHIPVVGIVENMSYFRCPGCGMEHAIFGESRVDAVAAQYGIPLTARLPIEPAVAKAMDEGTVESVHAPWLDGLLNGLLNG
ncbi:MAG: Mrp/NBP35 family ATP-binding protein [Clostridia bacterium]|nr:Mrp/NBP35 family ATP-binding protein [Clostridia bacterium]